MLASLFLEQFGEPDGELAAALRYFTQAISEDDPGRKDMLIDIATEELSHLEMIGSLVVMLCKRHCNAAALLFFLFDLLCINGADLMACPLLERNTRFAALLSNAPVAAGCVR